MSLSSKLTLWLTTLFLLPPLEETICLSLRLIKHWSPFSYVSHLMGDLSYPSTDTHWLEQPSHLASWLPCWWECKLVQPLWRTVWRLLKKLEIELPYARCILTDCSLERQVIHWDHILKSGDMENSMCKTALILQANTSIYLNEFL